MSRSAELVARCFSARTEAHFAHLLTNSYAEHKALNEFYDEIVELADTYAEACQGRCGLLEYPAQTPIVGDRTKPITIPTALRTWIDKYRSECESDRELQNLIEDILHQCDSTIYKLQFLS